MLPRTNLLLLVSMATLGSCGSDQARPPTCARPAPADARPPEPLLPVATAPVDGRLADSLESIRANFRRINAIRRWSAAVSRGLDEPGEGGEATFYYTHGQLEKVVARHYGEMGQRQVHYYLLGGQPSFVLEKLYHYNRPMYYDSAAMQAAHDTAAFAFDSSEVEEQRSYFVQGRLIRQLPQPAPDTPTTQFLRREQNRIKAEFRAVLSSRQELDAHTACSSPKLYSVPQKRLMHPLRHLS